NLNEVWGKKYADGSKLKTTESLAILKARLDLRPVRNTSVIEIRAYSEDRDEAARIANAVAEAYRDHRLQERERLMITGVKALEARYDEQQDKIHQTQSQLEKLRHELRISDADAQASAPIATFDAETQRRMQTQLLEDGRRMMELRLS